ncbi:MAG: T9SS type A sorting domain-containing protein [Phaeodactylibacter sp.]|nr:T9SS type A sorting domain-containing protein [Phaeodactylibacter sp.]MCB9273486.1 T9SS type A sorting domain-containing protein [Lewinellaceae bacterium]
MKPSTLLLLAFLFASKIFAQITIERQDYNLTSDGGTVQNWAMAKDGVSLPTEGADVIWDFSGQALTAPFDYTKSPVSEPLFPNANLVDYSSSLALGVAPQNVNFYEQLADDGYTTLGRITSSVTLPAQSLTGGPNDTISFLGVVSVYEEPIYYLKFPLNYADTWNTEINIPGNYLMTVQAFGLDHVPASSNYNYVETNTVAGYGTLLLPHPDGTGTVSIEALLLKSTTVRTDSFFLAGQPAPQLMLDALGLTQGFTEAYTDYAFFAKGLNRSALYMKTENGQVMSISIADDIRDIVSSAKSVANERIAASVFPNPSSGYFRVEFEKPDAQDWTLHLYNPLGQLVKEQKLEGPTGNTFAEVSLGQNARPGMYFLVLRNAKNTMMASERILVE